MVIRSLAVILAIHLVAYFCYAGTGSNQNEKGLLPEVRINSNNEKENEAKAYSSEVMITRTENKAIESLQNILKRKKGSAEEPDLLNRLAELYMRRSKSGRFFDLRQNSKNNQLTAFPAAAEKGSESIKKAISTYTYIEEKFPKYSEMDSVLFNNAFANQQIGQFKQAESLYNKMIDRFPKSFLYPDANLAAGELYYEEHKFGLALEYFKRIEKYPDSRVFSYGIYKSAWAYYNLKDSDHAIEQLILVVKTNPAEEINDQNRNRQNLRKESLRDLAIFIGDTYKAESLYPFFAKITVDEELGQAMMDLAKLYDSHSRQKEMNIFLSEFIKKSANNAQIINAHLSLADANEVLKKRDDVISHLKNVAELCKPTSSWSVAQKKENYEQACQKDFHKVAHELEKKWWEIWLKNKQNLEFSSLTEQVFKIILDNEEILRPDYKTRYAYAELLFQLGRFDEASHQYKLVGDNEKTDAIMKHDSDYAALFAKEKSIEKAKNADKEKDRKLLAQNYVLKHPTGAHANEVNFKIAHIYYEENNYQESEKILKLIAKQGQNHDLKIKAEDLLLDIYNIQKNYEQIRQHAQAIISTTKDETRKQNLTKILEEAHYAEIQEFAKKSDDKAAAAKKLSEFVSEHKHSSLSADALWQSIGLLYQAGESYQAAEKSEEFYNQYKSDKRAFDGLKETTRVFAETGDLKRAAKNLQILAVEDKKNKNQHLELAADFLWLEKKTSEARRIYHDLLTETDKTTRSRIYNKILATFAGQENNDEYNKIRNIVISQNIEPFATKILTDRAKAQLASGNMKDAFESARKIMNRDVPAEQRAEARLIQAKVLESEFVQQSVKSSREDKFAIVLSLKTEKLDKAQTAFLSASKMTQDKNTLIEAFSGIDRCYAHYVESMNSIVPPPSLSEADQKALKGEIAKIVAPIEAKRKDNSADLAKLTKMTIKDNSVGTNWDIVGIDKSPEPRILYPHPLKLNVYLPAHMEEQVDKLSRIETKSKQKCNLDKLDFKNSYEQAVTCLSVKDYQNADSAAKLLAQKKGPQQTWGLYLLSISAEGQGFKEKSLWLITQALKDHPHPLYQYQKAKLVYLIEGLNQYLPEIGKVLDTSLNFKEIEIIRGIRAFSEGDFKSSIAKFSGSSTEDLYNLNVGLLLSESLARIGEVEKAVKITTELIKIDKENVDIQLQMARIQETHKLAPVAALEHYKKALALTTDTKLKDWLNKKIEYLKNNNKVALHVISGD